MMKRLATYLFLVELCTLFPCLTVYSAELLLGSDKRADLVIRMQNGEDEMEENESSDLLCWFHRLFPQQRVAVWWNTYCSPCTTAWNRCSEINTQASDN